MKNIWLINYHGYPPGTSKWTRHFDLFKNLSKKYNFTVFGSSYIHDTGNQLLKEDEKIREEKYEDVTYKIIKSKGYKNIFQRYFAYVIFILKILFMKKNEVPNVVIGSSPDLLMGLGAYILSKRYKAKFIFEIRDVWPETLVELNVISRKSPIYFIFRNIEIFLYKKADAIIITAPGIKEHIENSKVNGNKIYYINNGVDLERFYKNLERNKEISILDKNKFNISYTGAIGLANGLDILVDSAKKISDLGYKDICINIIGAGPESERLKNKYPEIKNIRFQGSFPKERVPRILDESDCLFFSLQDKPLFLKFGISPNKLFEYLASGKPIVFSCKAYNDIVKIANAGISLEKLSVDKVVEGILSLYNMSSEERKILGENGKKYVKENFESKILSQKLENIFENL